MDYKQETMHSYNSNPDYFENKPVMYAREFKKDMKRFLRHLPRAALILDVGSGTGDIALGLKEAGYNMLCMDNSDVMVHICRKKGLKTLLSKNAQI